MKTWSEFHSVGELEHLRELARGASLEVAQLQPGTMCGTLAHAELGLSSVHMNRFNLPARGRGSLATDRWTFVVFPNEIHGHFNCRSICSDEMLIYPPGTEFEGTTSGPFQDWVFTVGFDDFARTSETISHQNLPTLSGRSECFRPAPQHLDRLRNFASNTMALVEQTPKALTDHRIRDSLHARMIEFLTHAVFSASSAPSHRQCIRRSHSRIVRQAEDFIHANLSKTVSLADLCSITDTSERTLRDAFLNVIGLSPNAYLKAARLNRVYAELERTSPDLGTVTSIAMRWGFFHLGHFSRDYRRFFGKLPSDTLRESSKRPYE